MAVTMLLIPNPWPRGYDQTERSIILNGQVLPYNSANALINITSVSITSNVVTFTAANSLTAGGGQAILVAGFQGPLAFINGGYTTTSATSTTIVCPLTASNLAATPCQALTTLSPNYATGGLAMGAFTDLSGKPSIIAGIGPNNAVDPIVMEVFSMGAVTTQNYKVNINANPVPLILDFTGITQATNATAIPADAIGFWGEWSKGMF